MYFLIGVAKKLQCGEASTEHILTEAGRRLG